MAALTVLRNTIQTDPQRATWTMACLAANPKLAESEAVRLVTSARTVAMRLAGVRAIQLLLGGQASKSKEGTAWEGYSARAPQEAR